MRFTDIAVVPWQTAEDDRNSISKYKSLDFKAFAVSKKTTLKP